LPRPASLGRRAGPDRPLRGRPGQRTEYRGPRYLRSVPVALDGRLDPDAAQALGIREGRPRLSRRRGGGVPRDGRAEAARPAGPCGARADLRPAPRDGQAVRPGAAGGVRTELPHPAELARGGTDARIAPGVLACPGSLQLAQKAVASLHGYLRVPAPPPALRLHRHVPLPLPAA